MDRLPPYFIFFFIENRSIPISAKICEQFLSKDWYASDGSEARGVEFNLLLDKLLQGYFHEAKFSFVRKELTWIVEEIQDATGKTGFLKTFPCFKKCVSVQLVADVENFNEIPFSFQNQFSTVLSCHIHLRHRCIESKA